MSRILIVDDEPIAAKSIEYMVHKNFDFVEVVGIARSGKEAIEKTYSLYPEIIVMDINMPGIDGIEAMRQIRKVNKSVKFIVISAYDYFDYAVEVLTLGAEEYILKPVKEAKFVEVLTKVVADIEHNRTVMLKNLEQQEQLNIVIPILEKGFMNSLCLFGGSKSELSTYCDLFGYSKSSGYVMAIEFGEKVSKQIMNKIGAGVQGEKMYGEYKKVIKSLCTCIVGPIMLNKIIIYVFNDSVEGNHEQKSQSIKIAEHITERIEKKYSDVFIGIGRFHSNITQAKKSYQEALFALKELSNSKVHNQILHVDDIIEKVTFTHSDYEEQLEEMVYSKITDGDVVQVQAGFDQIYTAMTTDANMDFDLIKKTMIGLVIELNKRREDVLEGYYQALIEMINSNETIDLYQICSKHIYDVFEQINDGRSKKINSIIDKANRYIEENYTVDISLEDVAQEVNLSSYYFCRFYKEEAGINFSDKLTDVRINKAKELLLDENLSIKDVCYMVGYMEPNYFSKIFKKSTGLTASEYKRNYGA